MIRGDVRCEGQERWFGKAGRDKFMHANRLVKLSHFFQLVSFKHIEILMVLHQNTVQYLCYYLTLELRAISMRTLGLCGMDGNISNSKLGLSFLNRV